PVHTRFLRPRRGWRPRTQCRAAHGAARRRSVQLAGTSGDSRRRLATVRLRLTSEGHWFEPSGHTGSAVLATDTVAVAVEPVDVGSDHLDGSLTVSGTVATAACTLDVASGRDTGAAVVR